MRSSNPSMSTIRLVILLLAILLGSQPITKFNYLEGCWISSPVTYLHALEDILFDFEAGFV